MVPLCLLLLPLRSLKVYSLSVRNVCCAQNSAQHAALPPSRRNHPAGSAIWLSARRITWSKFTPRPQIFSGAHNGGKNGWFRTGLILILLCVVGATAKQNLIGSCLKEGSTLFCDHDPQAWLMFPQDYSCFCSFNEIPKMGSHTSTHKSNLPKALQDVHFLGDLSHVWQVPPVEQALHRPQPPATFGVFQMAAEVRTGLRFIAL